MVGLLYEFPRSISYAHPWQVTWDGDDSPFNTIPTARNAGGTAAAISDSQRHETDLSTQNGMLEDVVSSQDAMEVDTQESARLQDSQDPVQTNEADSSEANDLVDMTFEGVDAVEADALVTFIR